MIRFFNNPRLKIIAIFAGYLLVAAALYIGLDAVFGIHRGEVGDRASQSVWTNIAPPKRRPWPAIRSRDGEGIPLVPWSSMAVLADSTEPVTHYQEKELLDLSEAMIRWLKTTPTRKEEEDEFEGRLGAGWRIAVITELEKNHGVKLIEPTQAVIGRWEFNFSTKLVGVILSDMRYGGIGIYFSNVRLENGQWKFDAMKVLWYEGYPARGRGR
jgi:hypothetical protein